MLIKYPALEQTLKKTKAILYILIGQDHYLLNESAVLIKHAWYPEHESKVFQFNNANDWSLLIEEANSYCLWAKYTLLDAHFDKKSLDATGIAAMKTYLKDPNPNCLIIIRAPLVSIKQLQWFSTQDNATVIQAQPLDKPQWMRFIADKLTAKSLIFDANILHLIYQYTQGNLLASVQLIEKLALIYDAKTTLTIPMVEEQLLDQCEYQLYELADAILAGNAEKAIHILRHAQLNRTEPTLILWLITQEIRLLLQLLNLMAKNIPVGRACQQLKVWQQRVVLYTNITKRLSLTDLNMLLLFCQKIDEIIKSSQNAFAWSYLEQLVIKLCAI